ncbi:hypothetical protein ACJMK2_005348 [Sinanodonta woodiana]|uniref:Uncharacterized protein n=1 Tax=Sinanodonta woodiana TaxID=1069815 RepID=A0ABD3VPR9_SINWO
MERLSGEGHDVYISCEFKKSTTSTTNHCATNAGPTSATSSSFNSVPQEPTTETEQIATSTPELTTEEIEIITRDEVNISPKGITEHRTELFDTDTLTWEKVKTCKRSRR